MNSLLQGKENIFQIKERVNSRDPTYFCHFMLNESKIDENTISIIMASSNRSTQTYYTLSSFMNLETKNIQLILVDDSTTDPIDVNKLAEYPFNIDFISINKDNKNWHNPSVNYNIGFQYVKGGKVMIQNAEVCHVGEVLDFVNKNLEENSYYVFDVKPARDFDANEKVYKHGVNDISVYEIKDIEIADTPWYQGEGERFLRNLHFLTAMTRATFDKIDGFSYDMTMGTGYDDDDFLLKIIGKGIKVIPLFHNLYGCGGFHLFHEISYKTWDTGKETNEKLFFKKKNYFEKHGEYLDTTKSKNSFDDMYKKLLEM